MADGRHRLIVSCLALGAVFLAAAVSAPAHAVTEKQLRADLAKQYGVRVLKLKRTTIDGRAVFLVTVMNQGGDFNAAFRVTRLAVDARTGKLISGFGHKASGLNPNPAPSYAPNRQSAGALRQGFTWR